MALKRAPRSFDTHLTAHVCTDIAATVLLMFASGGFRSGLAVMLLISLAAASLVSRGRLLLFYAALATIAVLAGAGGRVLAFGESLGGLPAAGMISIGYFATALVTNQLAQRVITNERVARQRGIDLANLLRINQLVIQDMQDGVLVVDVNGLVRSHNPQVGQLLGRPAPELEQIEAFSVELAQALADWRSGGGPRDTGADVARDRYGGARAVRGRRRRERQLHADLPRGPLRARGPGAADEARGAGPADRVHRARGAQSAVGDQPGGAAAERTKRGSPRASACSA